MGMQITKPTDPSKPRAVTIFDPFSGKKLGGGTIPPASTHRTTQREPEATTLKMFVGDVYGRFD